MKNQKPHTEEHSATASAKINWMPFIAAIVLFALITVMYFLPMFSENKILQQGDIVQGKGAAKELIDFRTQKHEEALWTNSMFGGMPAFQISVYYYGNIARYIDTVLSLGFPHPSQLLLIAFVGFFLLLLALDVSPWLSIAGAIAFGLSSYNLILLDAGHNSKLAAIGYMPMVLGGVLMVFRQKKYVFGAVVAALAVSLEVRANHLQISYYLFLILLAMGIAEFIHTVLKKEWKHFFTATGVLMIAAVFGVLSNLSLLWSTSEYASETIRGKSELSSNTQSKGGLDEDYAFQWSFGKMESLTAIIPNMFGGISGGAVSESSATYAALQKQGFSGQQLSQYSSQMPLYWGDQPFTSGPVYLGAICVFLFVLGMFLLKDRMKWWIFGISLLAVVLSWGHNFLWFNDFFFQYFPVYNKFRTVTMIMVIPQLCVPLLGILTLSEIIKRNMDMGVVIKKLLYSLYITGGICLLFALAGSAFFDFKGKGDAQYPEWLVTALISDRASLLQMDALRSLVLILLTAGAIWLFVKNRLSGNITVAALSLLIFIDLFSVGKRYLNDDKFVTQSDYDNYYAPSQADQQILQDNSLDYRVLNTTSNTFNDSRTSYLHKSIGGYHAAKLRRYQEIIENHINKQNAAVIDMLNTRYYIMSPGKDKAPMARPNYNALGNAWFVDSVMMVANADEELNRIGNMYEVNVTDGSSFTVNGKVVSGKGVVGQETNNGGGGYLIGNHDKVKIADADFDASQFGFSKDETKTFDISSRINKETSATEEFVENADSGAAGKFTARFVYDFNPRAYAVVDKRFAEQVKNFSSTTDSARTIQLKLYEPNHLIYESNSTTEGIAVFSEIYYANGWNVTVDGKPADYFRCNYILRGMKLPVGKHTIEWKFEPVSYFTGEKIAMASSALILLLFFGMVGMEVMKMRREK